MLFPIRVRYTVRLYNMPSLLSIPFFDALAEADSILLVGAGGGFDVSCGLPLQEARLGAGTTKRSKSFYPSPFPALPSAGWCRSTERTNRHANDAIARKFVRANGMPDRNRTAPHRQSGWG